MHNVIFQDFIHSTRGVLCIVLVATLMLGAYCMVTGRLMAPPHAAATTVDVTVVAEVPAAEEQAFAPWGTKVPVLSSLASMLVASDPDATPTSWHGLSVTLCKKLLQAGYL
ncbi:hypothetical protein [Eggerthella sinensis]|uniref:hypothetical protein n=1 Tax=Eggerthella sinensis TaxID=242230 RepID=UPI00266C528B|nr:hypothetical protein [Eggerthella sinensis]